MEIQIPAESGQSEGAQSNVDRASDAEDMRRVRDILFGSQLREIEQRIRTLEDDLQAKLASAREEVQKEREEFESKLEEKMDSLKGEFDTEKKDRTKALEDMAETTRQSVEEIEKRFTDITDQMEEGKVDRAELAKLFRHVSSELGTDDGVAQKTKEPEFFRELETDGVH